MFLNKANQVSNFVEEIFDLYHLNKLGFFYDINDDTFEDYDIPLFPNGEIDDETMTRLSIVLGLTKEEILELDDGVAMYKYWNKYPFFKLYDLFLDTWAWNSRYKERKITEEILLKKLFDENDEYQYPVEERYDYEDVKHRMFDMLKEMEKYISGTFPSNAKLNELMIDTEVVFSFPKITEMLHSYINMIEKVEQLFFKALKEPLLTDEINEYNFLVNVLQVVDVAMPSVLLTYDNVSKYRQVYIEEGYKDFLSYVKIRTSFIGTDEICQGTNPWRCIEFFDDMELVGKLAYLFPNIKALMHKFAMNVKNFHCSLTWSVDCSDNIEQSVIYVEKTKEELYNWEEYVEKINALSSPTNQGGLAIRPFDNSLTKTNLFKRMIRRFDLVNGGNQ